MKVIAVFAFLLIISFQSFAQVNQEKLLFAGKAEKFRKMKSTGTILTIGGGILFVVGLVTIVNAVDKSTYNSNTGNYQTSNSGNVEGGVAAYLVGIAGLGAGIPLWIVGAHNERKYNRKLEEMSVKLNVNPRSAGLTLIYRF